MADGDIASSLGWSVPVATEDKRNGWQRIAQALDKIASHIISGTHPVSSITGAATAADLAAEGVFRDSVDTSIRNGFLNSSSYGRFISGSWRSVVIQDDGTLGQRTTSSKHYKTHIKKAPVDWSVILRSPLLEPITYRRRGKSSAVTELGLIAENLHDAGLGAFVSYAPDKAGNPIPDGIHYDELAIAAIGAVRALACELDDLRKRLDKAGI